MENQTAQNPNSDPTLTPVQVSEPKAKFPVMYLVLSLLILVFLTSTIFFYYQNMQLKTMLASYQNSASPTPTTYQSPVPTPDPTANWKTYDNKNSQINFKYPAQISEMLETEGGVSGPILGNPNFVVSFADKTTGYPGTDAPFDGFSVYEIETAKLGMLFDTYIAKELEAVKISPRGISTASAVKTSIGGQNIIYIDSETSIRRYFILSPDTKRIAIFSRVNSTTDFLTTFDQILSTFKFTN